MLASLFWNVTQPRFVLSYPLSVQPIDPVFKCEDGIDRLYRNVSNVLLVYAA